MDSEQKKLIESAIVGDRSSIEKLLEYYMKDIYYMAIYHSNKQEAEDIAQNVAIILFEKIHTLSEADNFTKWISAVVRHASIAHMRRIYKSNNNVELEAYMESNDEVFHAQTAEFLPEKYVEDKELCDVVVEEIKKLLGNQRLCLAYHYLYGMKRSDIAEVTGLTPRQVSTALNYGKQTLKEKLEKRFGTSFAYSVASVAALPVLARAFQAEQEVLVSAEMCEQLVHNALDTVANIKVTPSKGISSSATMLTCICGAIVACTAILAVTLAGGEEMAAETAQPVQEVVQEQYLTVPEIPLEEEWVIRTVADMIGQEEADRLEYFVTSVDDGEEWQQFIQRIGAEEEQIVLEPYRTYTTYLLERQNKRLLLARQETAAGQNRVLYIFEDRDEPMIAMSIILLRFE